MMPVHQLPCLAFENKKEVDKSSAAGCFKCCAVFKPDEVKEYTDDGKTCVCPKCGCDCVIGDKSGYELSESSLLKAKSVIFG